jgi:Hsp70 protein
MELTPGVIIFAVVAVPAIFVLLRWALRHEAAAPVDTPAPPARNSTMAVREARESQPLVNWLLDRAFEETGIKVADDALARERIVQAAINATEDLRTGGSATISLPFLTADARGPKHFNVQFKRKPDSTFELQG